MVKLDIIARTSLNSRNGVELCNKLNIETQIETTIQVGNDTRMCNAKSLIGLLSMRITEGDRLTIVAQGADEQLAINIVAKYLE